MNDDLQSNSKDHLVALLRGAANAVPFVGGLLGELFTSTIPGQRHDRIAKYILELGARIDRMDQAQAKLALAEPDKISLIETGGYQAARATSDTRIGQIVNVVANGLSQTDVDVIRRNRLLALLGEIDDDEIAILSAYGLSQGTFGHEAWELIKIPPPATLGSDQATLDQNTLYKLGKAHLIRLDLLTRNFSRPKKGELPEFDTETGMMKSRVSISSLGRLLLREIGVLNSERN